MPDTMPTTAPVGGNERAWMREIIGEITKGAVLGTGTITVATPFLNWTNFRSDPDNVGKSFLSKNVLTSDEARRAFARKLPTGWRAYASSVAPSASIAITSHYLLQQLLGLDSASLSPIQKIALACAAGTISGAISAPFEGIAQTQQRAMTQQSANLKAYQTAVAIARLNGLAALMRGTGAIMAREGLYVSCYLALLPILSTHMRSVTSNETTADISAALVAGGTVGYVTTPLHCCFRFHKQQGMDAKGASVSYPNIARRVYKEAGGKPKNIPAAFFKNAGPRSATTVVATLCMFKGKELYDNFTDGFVERAGIRR